MHNRVNIRLVIFNNLMLRIRNRIILGYGGVLMLGFLFSMSCIPELSAYQPPANLAISSDKLQEPSTLSSPVPPGTEWDFNGWDKVPDILASIRVPEFPDRDYVITRFGAVRDGETDARPAIMAAISRAHDEGGGRVVLPEGIWLSNGPVHLKSNINLHISAGATLLFGSDPEYYLPVVFTRWEGTEMYNYSPFIYANKVTNVAITGSGTIHGNVKDSFAKWRPNQGPSREMLRDMGDRRVPVEERIFGEGHFLRPNMIQFIEAENVLMEGVTVTESPMWVNHFIYCNNVTVRSITVKSDYLNNDGINIDSSTNVLIEKNKVDTGDDCVVIKSGLNYDGWRVNRQSKNIIIRDNILTGHNALAIGSEMSGGVQNVFMENNNLVNVRSAMYFKSNLDRGGYIENVWLRNINVEKATILLRFHTNYHSPRGKNYPPVYRNFVIENVRAGHVERAIDAMGVEGQPIENVLVRNFVVESSTNAIRIENVKNFLFEDVRIDGK